MTYCIWCRYDRKVAVNLSGKRLENLSKEDAQSLLELIHPQIREMVEIRRMADTYTQN